MASSINADNGVVSGSSGLKSTADTSGVLALQSNGSTGVTLDTSLNVGVGTTSPASKLHVVGANTANRGQLSVQSDSAGNEALITMYDGTDNIGEFGTAGTSIYAYSAGNLLLYAGSTQRYVIGSAGQLGIGASPSYGSSGQVLTSGGSGAAPTWSTPNSGAMVFISSQTISTAVANVDFTSGFSTTYDNYVILLDEVTCSNAGTLGIRFYKDGVLASASGYIQNQIKASGTSVSASAGTGDSYFQVFSGDTVDSSSGPVQGTFNLYSANSTNAGITFVATTNSPSGNIYNKTGVGGGRNSTTGSFTGIRFFWTAGYNFTAGTFKLYGIKKA